MALLLRIKALALQKRPLFVLFALVGRTAAILDVAMLCAVEGAQCKTRELPLLQWLISDQLKEVDIIFLVEECFCYFSFLLVYSLQSARLSLKGNWPNVQHKLFLR